MVYTVTFNPSLDYVLKLDNFKCDGINRSRSEAIYYGGKGINVSVILSRLGVENTALGFVAGFTGGELEKRLLSEGVNCDFIRLKNGETRINVKIKADNEFEINASGPEITNAEVDSLIKKLDAVKKGDYIVLAGSVPKNLPPDIYEIIMEKLSGRGINFVVDAAGDLLKNTLKFKPFLIKPNHIELGELFGENAETDETVERLAKKLQNAGAKNVLVSRAEKGALLLDENGKVYKIKNAAGKLVNSVGCGDSAVGGFIAGYILKGDFGFALKLATACGNATAYSKTLATKEKTEKLLKETEF